MKFICIKFLIITETKPAFFESIVIIICKPAHQLVHFILMVSDRRLTFMGKQSAMPIVLRIEQLW